MATRKASSPRKATAHRGTSRSTTARKATGTTRRTRVTRATEPLDLDIELPYLKTTTGTHVYGYPPRSKEFKDSEAVPMLYIRKAAFTTDSAGRKRPVKPVPRVHVRITAE